MASRCRRIPCGRRLLAIRVPVLRTLRPRSSTWPTTRWSGAQDHYFAPIFPPDNPDTAAMVTLHNSISVPKDPKNPAPNSMNRYDVLGAAVGDVSGTTRERLFVGPKALPVLQSIRSNTAPGQMNGPDLRNVVDFGFFSQIGREACRERG